jgi:signal transduction histidine kinase
MLDVEQPMRSIEDRVVILRQRLRALPGEVKTVGGHPVRRRVRLEIGWGTPQGSDRPRRPVWPGLRIAVSALALAMAVIAAAAISIVGLGQPLLDRLLRRTRVLADRQRGRLPGSPIPSPYPPVPSHPTASPAAAGPAASGPATASLAAALRDPVTRRDLAWHLAFGITGTVYAVLFLLGWVIAAVWTLSPALAALTDPDLAYPNPLLGLFVALSVFLIQRLFPTIEIRMSRALLAPPLSRRVAHLTATRADAVDMQAAELARIERDLHDGAQARLVALALNLGLAEQMINRDPQAARSLVAEARAAAGTALGELRDVIRGLRPPLLADRGLAGGLEALALDSPLPVELAVDLATRPPPALESALYFTAAELLTNAARHSGAARIRLTVSSGNGTFRVHVEDDGCGGARLHHGGGLIGLQRRLAAFDGQLVLDSPPGQGTRVDVMVPCAP